MGLPKNIELRRKVIELKGQGLRPADIATHLGKSRSFVGLLVRQMEREDYLKQSMARRGMSDRNKDAIEYLKQLLRTDDYTHGKYKDGNWNIAQIRNRCREAGININTTILHYLLKRMGYRKRWVKL